METLARRLCRLNELMDVRHLEWCLSRSKCPRLLSSLAKRILLTISIGLHKSPVENRRSRLHRLLLSLCQPQRPSLLWLGLLTPGLGALPQMPLIQCLLHYPLCNASPAPVLVISLPFTLLPAFFFLPTKLVTW